MVALARVISFSQRWSAELTRSVAPSISTDVTRASLGPTTICHASVVRAGDGGWRRRISAMTGVTTVLTGSMTPNVDIINVVRMRLILASASPRRAELLRSAGFEFEVQASHRDEVPYPGEAAEAYTLRVARDKARHIADLPGSAGGVVLAADTEVVKDARILGKPRDPEDAAAMLRLLSGTAHDVLTAIVLRTGDREWVDVVSTRVHVVPLTDEDIRWYVASGEPMGKAGAYGIQGRAARFVERIEGSWSAVVGLPVAAVHRLLRAVE